MGSRVYDFLSESFLFDDSLLSVEFSGVTEAEILRELVRYREFCLSAAAELEQEASSNKSSLKLFSGIRRVSPRLLKQSAFYIEQHVLYDPLFELTWDVGRTKPSLGTFFDLKESPFNKKSLSEVIKYLKILTPMVAANYVKLLPTSYFLEPPEQIPFRHSETGFADILPEPLMKFFWDNAIVESIKIRDGKVTVDGGLELGRAINVRFKDHGFEDARQYLLRQMSVDPDKGPAEVVSDTPDTPPDPAKFDRWVFQSTNQTAEHLYKRVVLENIYAARFGASYLSNSPFIFKLLEQIVPVEDSVQTNTANTLMSMELPFLDDVDVETLMKVRQEDGEAFQSFRLELDKQLRELRLVSDPEALKIKAENVVHELSEVQVNQINQKLTYLKNRFLAEAMIAAGTLLGAVQTGGMILPVSLVAAFQSYKSLAEYQRQKKENPAFFLWKVLRKK